MLLCTSTNTIIDVWINRAQSITSNSWYSPQKCICLTLFGTAVCKLRYARRRGFLCENCTSFTRVKQLFPVGDYAARLLVPTIHIIILCSWIFNSILHGYNAYLLCTKSLLILLLQLDSKFSKECTDLDNFDNFKKFLLLLIL